MSVGYLLVGHGTRNQAGQAQFRQVYREFVEFMAPQPTELAFLELAAPDIPSAVTRMAAKGVHSLVTVPVLLFSAGHAKRDIPIAVEAVASRLGLDVVEQMPALECCKPILDLSALRFREAVCRPVDHEANSRQEANSGQVADPGCTAECLGVFCNQAGLVMVGRGSKSASATEEMRRFTTLRREYTPVAWSQTAFIHGQTPDVPHALDELAACDQPIAIVQPHLLFEGELIVQLRAEVARRQQLQPQKRWIITESLGTDSSLARTLASVACNKPEPAHGRINTGVEASPTEPNPPR